MNFQELEAKIGKQNKTDWRQHRKGGGWVHKDASVAASSFVAPTAIVFGYVCGRAKIGHGVKIERKAKIGSYTTIDDYTVIQNGVEIGSSTHISKYVRIESCTTIKNRVNIGHGAEIGRYTQIEDDNEIGSWTRILDFVRIEKNAKIGIRAEIGNCTKIGISTNVGEFAKIENNVRIRNFANIEDKAKIGRFSQIGNYAQIGNSAEIREYAVIGDKEIWRHSQLFIQGSKHALCNNKLGHIQIGAYRMPFTWWLVEGLKCLARESGYTKDQIREYKAHIDHIIKVGKAY